MLFQGFLLSVKRQSPRTSETHQKTTVFWVVVSRSLIQVSDISEVLTASVIRAINHRSDTQEIHYILWNTRNYNRACRSPPVDRILNHNNPIHIFPSFTTSNYFNIIFHLLLGFPGNLLSSAFQTKMYPFRISPCNLNSPPISITFRFHTDNLFAESSILGSHGGEYRDGCLLKILTHVRNPSASDFWGQFLCVLVLQRQVWCT
jgi:hypothetical protein